MYSFRGSVAWMCIWAFQAMLSAQAAQCLNILPRQEGSVIPTYDPGSFSRSAFVGTFIINDILYIDGGERMLSEDRSKPYPNNYTIAIGLKESFNTSASLREVKATNIDRGECPGFNGAKYWVNEKEQVAYLYGGDHGYIWDWDNGASVPPESFWEFVPSTEGTIGEWKELDQSSDNVWRSLRRTAWAQAAFSNDRGWSLGGVQGSRTSRATNIDGWLFPPGLQSYHFSTGTWQNVSTADIGNGGQMQDGVLHYLDNWGEQGTLVTFSGRYAADPRLNDEVHIYDIATNSWFTQRTTGSEPSPRSMACSVGAASLANDTFEIYFYGGKWGNEQDGEVYILSLPAFHWFTSDLPPSNDTRIWHECRRVQNQMLSVGGLTYDVNGTVLWNQTDEYTEGIKVFDMSELRWTNYFNASANEYDSPNVVKEFYANRATRFPATWTNPDLKNIFDPSPRPTDDAESTNSTTSSPTPQSSDTASSSSTNIGAIVGGSVGGGLGAIAIILLLLYFLRWRPKRQQARKNTSSSPPPPRSDKIAEAGGYEKARYAEMAGSLYLGQELPSPPSGTIPELDAEGNKGRTDDYPFPRPAADVDVSTQSRAGEAVVTDTTLVDGSNGSVRGR